MAPDELTHIRHDGTAAMVDVSDKAVTKRTATARGLFRTTPQVIAAIASGDAPKGDVLATARIAGIAGAKRTSDLIPLCHPLPLSKVAVDFELGADSVAVSATVSTTGRTGVEMEALTAVTVAGLTLHDMVKALDPAASLTEVALHAKDGGRHGRWRRDADSETDVAVEADAAVETPPRAPAPGGVVGDRTATVIVSSTRVAAGEREDATGPVIARWLSDRGFATGEPVVVADADIAAAVADAVAAAPSLLITTGGTGPTSDDSTPEATAPHITTALPGVAEELRAAGRAKTPYSSLSRGLVGYAGRTLVANLPGSRGGVRDGLEVLGPLVDHLFHLASGGDHG